MALPANSEVSRTLAKVASFLVAAYPGQRVPAWSQLMGAGIILLAILFLTIPPMLEKRRRRLAAQVVPRA